MTPIRYKDLLINFTHHFAYYWNNGPTPDAKPRVGKTPITLWRPRVPPDLAEYSILGDVLETHFNDIQGMKVIPVVCDANGASGTALRAPTGFTRLWELFDPVDSRVSIWRPTPPPGYVSMGLVTGNGLYPPDVDTVTCLREDLVVQAQVEHLLWNDKNTGAPLDFSAWDTAPPTPEPGDVYFGAGTFIGHSRYTKPAATDLAFSLRANVPIPGEIKQSRAPVLLSYARPTAFERNTATYTLQIPWFVVADPSLSALQQLTQSPNYQLQITEQYVLKSHSHNNTADVQRYTWTRHSSESITATQMRSETTGMETSAEAQFASFFKMSAKISHSVSQSNAISRDWTTAQSFTIWCTLGAYKAIAIFLIRYTYRLLRTDGSQVGEGLVREPDDSLYWTEYPAVSSSTTRVQRVAQDIE